MYRKVVVIAGGCTDSGRALVMCQARVLARFSRYGRVLRFSGPKPRRAGML